MAASPGSAAASSSPRNTMQYLSALLSQRGPNALPYHENVKLLIRQHLLNLMQDFPSLHVKPAPFVHNDGASLHLLQVEGTIPMTFHGLSYNIPVVLWLLESYPKSPPRVFVSPTKDMVIKRPHKHVDASGMVSLPYLTSWFYPRSNLSDLGRALSDMFSQDPPLFSKPSSPQPTRSHGVAAGSAVSNPNPYTASPLASPARLPGSPLNQRPPSPKRTESPGSSASRLSSSRYGRNENSRSGRTDGPRSGYTDNPAEVFRRNAINSLVDRLKLDTSEMRKTFEVDMDKLVNVQSQLKQRRDQLKQATEQLQQEKEGLEHQLRNIQTNTDMLISWIHKHGETPSNIDVDDAFEPFDALSKQLLECNSLDLALEDIFYSLDKAVQEGSMSVDTYLKQVRTLAREQFFYRATSAKVQACQQQMHVTRMAERHGL